MGIGETLHRFPRNAESFQIKRRAFRLVPPDGGFLVWIKYALLAWHSLTIISCTQQITKDKLWKIYSRCFFRSSRTVLLCHCLTIIQNALNNNRYTDIIRSEYVDYAVRLPKMEIRNKTPQPVFCLCLLSCRPSVRLQLDEGIASRTVFHIYRDQAGRRLEKPPRWRSLWS